MLRPLLFILMVACALPAATTTLTTATVNAAHVPVVITNVGTTSATISWTTDQESSSQVAYGTTPDYGSLTTLDPTLVLTHSVTISGLSACSTYYFQPMSVSGGDDIASGSAGVIFTTGCAGLSNSVPTACYPYDPYKQIHVHNTGDISTVRAAAINDIWRVTHALPTRLPDTVTLATGTTYTYLDTSTMTNLNTIDKFGVDVEGGFHSEAILLRPITSNNRLAIMHQGHCVAGGLANNLNDIRVKETIVQLNTEGFYVAAFQLPGCGPNTPAAAGGDSPAAHNGYRSLESSTYNPMKAFLEPVAVVLNYLDANYSFTDRVMVGISGGGWMTTVYSAIDPRITRSFPVSGSMPNGLRALNCLQVSPPEGDYEQGDQVAGSRVPLNFFLNVMSYEDAYVIGSSQGRRQVQLIRQNDPCCFGGPRYQTYESTINSLGTFLSGAGFKVYLDTVSTTHEISAAQRATIAAELGF